MNTDANVYLLIRCRYTPDTPVAEGTIRAQMHRWAKTLAADPFGESTRVNDSLLLDAVSDEDALQPPAPSFAAGEPVQSPIPSGETHESLMERILAGKHISTGPSIVRPLVKVEPSQWNVDSTEPMEW